MTSSAWHEPHSALECFRDAFPFRGLWPLHSTFAAVRNSSKTLPEFCLRGVSSSAFLDFFLLGHGIGSKLRPWLLYARLIRVYAHIVLLPLPNQLPNQLQYAFVAHDYAGRPLLEVRCGCTSMYTNKFLTLFLVYSPHCACSVVCFFLHRACSINLPAAATATTRSSEKSFL